jgi:acetolactate synthase-1/2/3 large subunit
MLGHNRKMSGAECLADMLKGYGVTHVFHVPAVLRKTFAVMETRTDIKRLHVHGEKAAAYMADGYARASGKARYLRGAGDRAPQSRGRDCATPGSRTRR